MTSLKALQSTKIPLVIVFLSLLVIVSLSNLQSKLFIPEDFGDTNINNSFVNNTFINQTKSNIVLLSGISETPLIINKYFHISGGTGTTFNDIDDTLMRLNYNGKLHNLTYVSQVIQDSGDVCVLYINYNTTFGTATPSLLFANLTGINQTITNKTASLNVTKDSYIKIFFEEQDGTCSGTGSWSFYYEF